MIPKVDERLEHIMATGMIGAFFEMVLQSDVRVGKIN